MIAVLADAAGTLQTVTLVVGLIGGTSGIVAAVRQIWTVRSEKRKLDASAEVDGANAFTITQDGWAKMLNGQRELLKEEEVRRARLQADLDAQREAFETRTAKMQVQLDALSERAAQDASRLDGLERIVGMLRQQIRQLGHEPVA